MVELTPTPCSAAVAEPAPDVVVTRDGLEYAYTLCGTRYEPEYHRLLETPLWLQAISRWSRQPDLFLMQSEVSGRHVICQWVIKPNEGNGPGAFVEVRSYEPEEGPGTREEITQQMVPQHVMRARIRKKILDARSVAKMLREDSWAERQATAQYLKNKGMYEEGKQLARGQTPFMGTKEAEAKGYSNDIASLKA
jgi:hypothetical protein